MAKQKKKPRLPLPKIDGSKALEVLRILCNHPTIAALGVMTGTVLAQIALKPAEMNGNKTAEAINYQLGGLYQGAQGVVIATAVVPIIQSAAGAAIAFAPKAATAGAA